MMSKRITLLNMISGIILQAFTILSGFILPKIILLFFGSDVNGLVSSLNQFLSYITLIEGGITGVIIANLYKPLVDNDSDRLSSIVVTSNIFFKKIGLIFIVYSISLALLHPFIFRANFDYFYVFTLTLILSLTLLVQYMFSLTLRCVLDADKKSYIVNFTQTIITFLNILLALVSAYIYPSIHILKLISGLLFVIQPIVYRKFIRDHYSIDWNAKTNNDLIKERWNGFAVNLAAFIHNSADVTILTIFTNLKIVSIYSIYCLVANGIKQLINASVSGISHTVGRSYAKKDYKEVNRKLNLYEYVVFVLVFFISTIACLLIVPFVQLYTKGVTDANYYQPIFGVLLIISEALYLIKIPHLSLAYSSNSFKEITIPAFIEAFLNIIISILLVKFWGLIGVAFGTIAGMLYRMFFHVRFTKKLLPGRGQKIFYKKFLLFSITSILGVIICKKYVQFGEISFSSLLINGIIYSLIIGGMYLCLSIICFNDEIKFFVKYLKR